MPTTAQIADLIDRHHRAVQRLDAHAAGADLPHKADTNETARRSTLRSDLLSEGSPFVFRHELVTAALRSDDGAAHLERVVRDLEAALDGRGVR